MNQQVIDILDSLEGKKYHNFPLRNQSWFKTGGNAEHFYIPSSEEDLINLIKIIPQEIKITIIGAGSNILINDEGIQGLVIKLQNLNNIEVLSDNRIKVSSGALNVTVSNVAYDNEIGGLEFVSGIPGSIGGGIFMNAGCFGKEFKDIIESVEGIDYRGNRIILSNQECNFSYRKSEFKEKIIVIGCILKGDIKPKVAIKTQIDKIKQEREENQPKKVLTGGSTFANPKNDNNYKAWQLIDMVGLRGYKIGGASFSQKHCNFIINEGNAKSKDIEELIKEAISRVRNKFNIELKPEIKILK